MGDTENGERSDSFPCNECDSPVFTTFVQCRMHRVIEHNDRSYVSEDLGK